MDSDLAWVNGKSAIDKADAMLTLSSANIGSHLQFTMIFDYAIGSEVNYQCTRVRNSRGSGGGRSRRRS